MKKFVISIAIFLGIILALLAAGSLTGSLRMYNIPSTANEPNIKKREQIYVSNLKKPMRSQFIAFKNIHFDSAQAEYNPDYKTGETYLYRVCGIAGDVLQMRNGVLFVNNTNFDDALNLKKQYTISNEDYYLLNEVDRINDNENETMVNSGNTLITIEDVVLKKYQTKIKFTPYLINNSSTLWGCFKWFSKSSTWTTDNFGPIKIPNDSYFVLGDNRHFAQDSRYIGFIKKEAVKGIVLGK